MPLLYLCIDGGGTKTAAVVAKVDDGKVTGYGRGQAGPSNLTFGLENCLSATSTAVTNALRDLDPLLVDPTSSPALSFQLVWAGYAGCARPDDHRSLFQPLMRLFNCSCLKLTSDGELLTSPLRFWPGLRCITLICGTGSLGLLWERTKGELVRQGRSGGWGSVLGDEGSGWSLGREGIKSVLSYTANGQTLLPWHREIMDQLKVCHPDQLFSTAISLDQDQPPGRAESERKKRIAGCAKIVNAANDIEASRIKLKVAKEVIETLRPLVEKIRGDVDDTLLSVTGGLGRSAFWDIVLQLMDKEGWSWGRVVHITDPSDEGLESILREGGYA